MVDFYLEQQEIKAIFTLLHSRMLSLTGNLRQNKQNARF